MTVRGRAMSDSFAMARARRALGEAGLDMHLPLTRASSVTNEVWLSDEYVVRVNRQPNQRLRREAVARAAAAPRGRLPRDRRLRRPARRRLARRSAASPATC